jgi:hypothetical protein
MDAFIILVSFALEQSCVLGGSEQDKPYTRQTAGTMLDNDALGDLVLLVYIIYRGVGICIMKAI